MQALILAGGEGTRLRPLTSTVPKPVVPLVDRPFISYMLDWLRRQGIDDVIISCGYLASGIRNVLGDGDAFGVRLRYVEEQEPMGTGGAVKLAEPLLEDRFVVLNGDVLTDLDLRGQIERHEAVGARATLALIGVADPSAYGLVHTAGNGEVTAFVEKPSADRVDTNLVSAGAYVLEHDVLGLMPPDENVSIERDVFPALIGNGLFGHEVSGYWLDIGTPQRYLQATFDILEGEVETPVRDRLGSDFRWLADDVEDLGRIVPPVLIERGCRVGPHAHVGPRVVLGRGVQIAEDARVEDSVVLDGAEIGAGAALSSC